MDRLAEEFSEIGSSTTILRAAGTVPATKFLVGNMAKVAITELELCDLVQRTLERAWTPEMPPEVWMALRQFGLRLLDEATKPGEERRAQMKREIEERLARLHGRGGGKGPAAR